MTNYTLAYPDVYAKFLADEQLEKDKKLADIDRKLDETGKTRPV